MNFRIFLVSCLTSLVLLGAASVVAAPAEEEKAAKEAARKAEKARNDRFNALCKEGQELVRKDFTGGFANYWHTSIDAARAKYEAALKEDYTVQQKVELYARIANCRLEATRDVAGALKDLDAAIALAGADEKAKEKALANKKRVESLLDGSAFAPKPEKPYEPRNVVEAKIIELNGAGGFAKVKAELPAFLAAEQKKVDADPKSRFRACYKAAWDYVYPWGWSWRSNEPKALRNQPGAKEFMLTVMEAAPTNQALTAEAAFDHTANCAALRTKHYEYAKKLLVAAKDPKNRVKPEKAAEADLFAKLYEAKGDPSKVIAAFESTNRVAWAESLGKAARALLKDGNEDAARKVWAKRAEIAPPVRQPVLDMPFWKDAPHDIRGILESDFYKKAAKGLLNRRYGDNLKFLIETDSATLGREMTTDKGEAFRPTELFAFWDQYGVKILLRSYVDNIADVRLGYGGPGGYETYLSTGIDDPYHCIMFDSREGAERPDDSFVTQYNNGTGYRRVNLKDGTLEFTNLYLDDGAVTLITIPWCAAFAAAPWNREAWYFEPIHWAHGGLSWGGSISVHNRSTFGKLRFTGGDAASYTAVKRILLPVAKAKFGNACSARGNGQVEVWSDPELGDQEFYLAEVKPLVERIKPLMALVKKDMSDADVVKVWDAVGEDAMNVDFIVSRLRTKWLDAKRLGARIR